jgi:transglutaminase-like putative cysteine protease
MNSARFHVLHETRYEYAATVSLSQKLLHLIPRSFQFQTCESHSISLNPIDSERSSRVDFFGNHTSYCVVTEPHQNLLVRAESTLTLHSRPGQELLANSRPWEEVRDSIQMLNNPARLEVIKYLYTSTHITYSEELADYARASFQHGRNVLEAAFDLTRRIHSEFAFDSEATDISTPLSELLRIKRGVCQDFAHLMIGCLRAIGLACRYVSGYILTHPAPGKSRLIGADASHAWVSVYCPSIGWVDFDPTNCCMVNMEHVTLGWGRDFSDVSIIRGVMLGGGAQTLKVNVTMTELENSFSTLPTYATFSTL